MRHESAYTTAARDFLFDSFLGSKAVAESTANGAQGGKAMHSVWVQVQLTEQELQVRTRPVQGIPHSTENSHTWQRSGSFIPEGGFIRQKVRAQFHHYSSVPCQKREMTWGASIK